MKIIHTAILSEQQKKDIRSLINDCRSSCSLTLSFPYREATSFYLLYDTDLISVLALTPSGEEMPDRTSDEITPAFLTAGLSESTLPAPDLPTAMFCSAFTHPARQNAGCFSVLLEAASAETEDTDLLFYTDHSNTGALKTLKALEAEHISDDYRMELSLSGCSVSPQYSADRNPVPRLTCRMAATGSAVPPQELLFTFCDFATSGEAGSAHAEIHDRTACLHSFELLPSFRGRGLGKEALRLFLSLMQAQSITTVILHVTGENLPAVSLYRKTGFRMTETLSLYLY